MTNGEKIQKDFKGCEVCEPIVEDDIIHVIFADKKDSAIGFDWSWWNAEYKESTTKNDLGVDPVSRQFMRELGATCIATRDKNNKLIALGALDELPSVTPKQRTGKWIKSRDGYGNNHYTCPFCEHDIATKYAGIWKDNYCSNCGAKMVELQESEG